MRPNVNYTTYLRPLIFGFTLFGWFVPFYLNIFYYKNIIFDLRQLFSETQLGLQTIYRHPRNTTTYGDEQTVALFGGLALCLLNYCT